jgi:hypothetical protein
MPYGVDDLLWDELLEHTADVLGDVAAAGATIQYGQLSQKLHSRLPQVKLDPHYGAMPHLLEEVNVVVSRRDPERAAAPSPPVASLHLAEPELHAIAHLVAQTLGGLVEATTRLVGVSADDQRGDHRCA